jgi:hypothetical protein
VLFLIIFLSVFTEHPLNNTVIMSRALWQSLWMRTIVAHALLWITGVYLALTYCTKLWRKSYLTGCTSKLRECLMPPALFPLSSVSHKHLFPSPQPPMENDSRAYYLLTGKRSQFLRGCRIPWQRQAWAIFS